MRAFHFRLDQALRWRAAQLDLEKSRVSLAAKLLQDLRSEIETRRRDLADGAGQLSAHGGTGSSLALWAGFTDRSRRQTNELEKRAVQAAQALSAQMQLLVEANRKARLLENLKQDERSQWHAEFNRELESFAGESYLFRLQSRNRMGA
jgi:capsule polysaccharide export protein KpsE/RkpR